HRGAQNVAEEIVGRLHLNLARRHPRILLDALNHLDDGKLRKLALAALLYAAMRFAEAYGLWRKRRWAEWFAILSGGIYLPVEVWELAKHPTTIKGGILGINAVIVVYLLRLRWTA